LNSHPKKHYIIEVILQKTLHYWTVILQKNTNSHPTRRTTLLNSHPTNEHCWTVKKRVTVD
jgi:hypothetical protein